MLPKTNKNILLSTTNENALKNRNKNIVVKVTLWEKSRAKHSMEDKRIYGIQMCHYETSQCMKAIIVDMEKTDNQPSF